MMNKGQSKFLFSVDVEDFPVVIDGKDTHAGRVTELVDQYIGFLGRHQMQATFFVLGETAERYPDVVKKIIGAGHELGSHGYGHVTLDKLSEKEFKDDLYKALDVLHKSAGTSRLSIKGYRAPFLSLIPETAWIYEILPEYGFTYSSSVNPKYNPSFGWPDFGFDPKMMGKILELPVSVIEDIPWGIPLAGGVYFRMLPMAVLERAFKRHTKNGKPVLAYFHPYDLDWQSVSKQCSWLKRNPLYNFFMFYNRKDLLKRLDKVMQQGLEIVPYQQYVAELPGFDSRAGGPGVDRIHLQ